MARGKDKRERELNFEHKPAASAKQSELPAESTSPTKCSRKAGGKVIILYGLVSSFL